MKVILLENLKKIGSIGEVIDVKRGFARNFLIANKKALYASKENIKQVEKIKSDLGKKDLEKKKESKEIHDKIWKSTQERINLLTKRVHNILGSNLKNKKISFLGVTFKPNTDDMRDSSSLKMIPYLCKKGAKVRYYDPSGEKNEFRKIKNCNYINNIKSNCNDADLVVLLTEWDEFKSIDFKKIVKNNKFKVDDLRNLYSAEEMKKNKINYYSVGRPNTN